VAPRVRFRETMSGAYYLLAQPFDERPVRLAVEAQVDDLPRFMIDRTCRLEGELDMDGWADRRPIEGTLAIHLFDQRRLAYRVRFTANDGAKYELGGQKEWNPLSPIASLTVLPAGIYDAQGEEIGRASLRFDLKSDLRPLLASLGFSLS
jgi:hypothetical protein